MFRSLNPGMVNLKVSFAQAVALAAEYGFGAVEYDPLTAASELGIPGMLDEMGKYGVILSSFGLPVTFQRGEAEFSATFPRLESAVRAARALGCRRASTYVFSWSDELPFADNFRLHVRRLRACAEVCREYDVSLGLEFLGPQTLYSGKPHRFIHTLDGMLALCEAIGTGNAGILLDAYHCYTAGVDMENFVRFFKKESQIVTVHINDAPKGEPIESLPDTLRYLPGEGGGINLRAFLRALDAFGYTGPVVTEPFSQKLKALHDPAQILQAVKESIDNVWPRDGREEA